MDVLNCAESPAPTMAASTIMNWLRRCSGLLGTASGILAGRSPGCSTGRRASTIPGSMSLEIRPRCMLRTATYSCFWLTITAQVTENVFDSPTGRYLLIPQGSKLIGTYDSQVSFGQDRVLLVWTRLIMPSGRSIVLERQPGADSQGFAGLEDQVDRHWGRLLTAAALSTVL